MVSQQGSICSLGMDSEPCELLCHLHTTRLYSKPHGHFFEVLLFGELELPKVSRDHRNLQSTMHLVDKDPSIL